MNRLAIIGVIVFFICTGVVLYYLNWEANMNKIASYKPYPIQYNQLSNGLQVILIKSDELPSIAYEMMFKTGSKIDPQDKQGLMYLLIELINKGTANYSAEQLAENLELLGSFFGAYVAKDYTSFSVETLSWLHKPLLSFFSEIITKPVFPENEFKKIKKKTMGLIKRSTEDLGGYAQRIFFGHYLYSDHPYGFYTGGDLKTLQAINVADIRSFYKKYFTPDNAILSVSGKYPDDIMEMLESVFKSWVPFGDTQENTYKANTFEQYDDTKKPIELLLVDHPAAIQSEIYLGHLSVKRSHPDYLPLRIASVILGGSMTSRLMQRLRVQKGLTYGVSSSFNFKKELGAFSISMAVRNNQLGTSLLEIMGVLKKFHKEGVTKEELHKAKELLKNSFITKTTTPEGLASLLMELNIYEISDSFIKNYFKNINELDITRINEAITKHLHPQRIKAVILSKVDEVKSQLSDYTNVTIKDYKDFL